MAGILPDARLEQERENQKVNRAEAGLPPGTAVSKENYLGFKLRGLVEIVNKIDDINELRVYHVHRIVDYLVTYLL